MKKKLFENVGGNQFKLLTESFDAPEGTKLMREGLKKVFAAHKTAIPYKVLTNVGLGYIKSVNEAVKYALLEAQDLAPSFGFKDDEANQRFVKEDGEMSDWDIAAGENGLSQMAGTRKKDSEQSSSPGNSSDEWNEKNFGAGADNAIPLIQALHQGLKDPKSVAMMMIQYELFKERGSFLPNTTLYDRYYAPLVQRMSQEIQNKNYKKAYIVLMSAIA